MAYRTVRRRVPPHVSIAIWLVTTSTTILAAGRCPYLPSYLQPGNYTPPAPHTNNAIIDIMGVMRRMEWLIDKVTDRWFGARILPQLHVLLWGNARGV